MNIKNLRNYENTFLIVVSLLFSILYTLPFFLGGLQGNAGSSNPFRNPDFVIPRSFWYLAQTFASFLIFSYFNYRWKHYIIPAKLTKTIRWLLLFVFNIILIVLMLFFTVQFAEYTVGNPFGADKAYYFYFWKYVFVFPVALLLAYILHLITKTRIVEVENAKLKEENLSSQLKSLKDQINPHFLFNSLNTLSSTIHLNKKDNALRFVDDLSSVYRYILDRYEENMVRLEDELKVLESYIYMQKQRFEEKLDIHIDIPGHFKSEFVPPMALHVLVENAIKHNEISAASPLRIEIKGEGKYLSVSNNLQLKVMEHDKLGLGLSNLSKRYNLLTGNEIIIKQSKESFVVKLPVIKK